MSTSSSVCSTTAPESVDFPRDIQLSSSLEKLQSKEQSHVLQVVADLRKCGLEGVLSLPQLVVCGDQSAGKSSVLEALTEIPFPRNDNLCTRFPTEIILRQAPIESLTIRVIPNDDRSAYEKDKIKSFSQIITDFEELATVMQNAMDVMGLSNDGVPIEGAPAFAKDVLSIEIEGPNRPHVSLVDLPGLIQSETEGVTKEDVQAVAEITDRYISQDRTICLAVISATYDYANQAILRKVREFDPNGSRTLGIITKPDRLEHGSGSEKSTIKLANNDDVHFDLGWHVLKNRNFKNLDSSIAARNDSEREFFATSSFQILPRNMVGIDSLRSRLSHLLYDHVKSSLPTLRDELLAALEQSQTEKSSLGPCRSSASQCKEFLFSLSQQYMDMTRAAARGHYEGHFFRGSYIHNNDLALNKTSRKLRAVIQQLNSQFADDLRKNGHTFEVSDLDSSKGFSFEDLLALVVLDDDGLALARQESLTADSPVSITGAEAFAWIQEKISESRGQELLGNWNPLIVGELFWEQSARWKQIAQDHLEDVDQTCQSFLQDVLDQICPEDFRSRLWSLRFQEALEERKAGAVSELMKLENDREHHPINYNGIYTSFVQKRKDKRISDALESGMGTRNMTRIFDKHSCAEALDCLYAIYEIEMERYVANVTIQAVERHIVRGLEDILSATVINNMSDEDAEEIAAENSSIKSLREQLDERIQKLEKGRSALRKVLRG